MSKTIPTSKAKTRQSRVQKDKLGTNIRPKSQKKPLLKKLKPEFASLPELLTANKAIEVLKNSMKVKVKINKV